MAPKQLPGQQQGSPTLSGPMSAVPCPHCGRKQDFRPLNDQQLLDTGSEFACDDCGYSQLVVAIQPVTIVTVRKNPRMPGRAPQQAPMPQPGRAVSPGLVNKLLGRGRR